MAPFSDGRGEVEAVLGVELGLLGAGHGTLNFVTWERFPASDDDLEADILMTVLQVAVVRAGSNGEPRGQGVEGIESLGDATAPHQDKEPSAKMALSQQRQEQTYKRNRDKFSVQPSVYGASCLGGG
jgi:hypothetical protein